jgi:hypothetical protein
MPWVNGINPNRIEIGCPIRRCQAVFGGSMYQRCISSGSTGLCWPVRLVPGRSDITPARSIHSDTNRHRPTRLDTSVFRLWEQEAGSSNLPTPTGLVGLNAAHNAAQTWHACRFWSDTIEQDVARSAASSPCWSSSAWHAYVPTGQSSGTTKPGSWNAVAVHGELHRGLVFCWQKRCWVNARVRREHPL